MSPTVAGCLSLSLSVPWSCFMSHTVSYCCWLSLTIHKVPWSCCISLTLSHVYWLSHTFSLSAMEILTVSHFLPRLLAVSHCLFCLMELLNVSHCPSLLLGVSHCLSGSMKPLHVSGCLLLSFQSLSVGTYLSLSPMVAGFFL